MKNTRRDIRLDKFIGKEVIVEFKDGRQKEGILGFNGHGYIGYYPGHYTVGSMAFRKSHVSRIKAKGENEKWVSMYYISKHILGYSS